MTLESSKVSALLDVLDFNPDVSQKTLIVVDSAEEVEDVFKVKRWLTVCVPSGFKGSHHHLNLFLLPGSEQQVGVLPQDPRGVNSPV